MSKVLVDRECLKQALDMLEEQALHIGTPMLPAGEELLSSIRAAISQQVGPAPAQDEREAFEAWVRDHLPGTQERFPDGVYRDWSIECAWQGYQARPAQTEQDTFCTYCGGNDEEIQDHCMDCKRPLAQTDQQPEQSGHPFVWPRTAF